ncbi:MAG: tetratricopeptide repeat protein [Blastocatellia bacterium]
MNQKAVEMDTQLRRYLLDELPANEQQSIEERLLVDNEYLEQMLIVEEDLIDDYTANKLSPQQTASYQKLFLASPEGGQKLQVTQVLKKHLTQFAPEPERQLTLVERIQTAFARLFTVPVLAATAAVFVIGLSVLSWRAFFQSDLRKGMTALQVAYREQRPLEARISGFQHASFSNSAQLPSQSSAKLKVADKAFHNLMDDKKTASSLHELGKYLLTQKKFDEAIKNLEEAVKTNSKNAAIHTDLAVAFLERGKLAHPEASQSDFESCHKHLDHALAQNPSSPEALFNLALLQHTTKSWKDAEASWQRFLAIEPNTKWAEEAKRYLNLAIDAQKH